MVEFKEQNSQGNYEKVNTAQDGMVSLGAYKRGTVLKYKASKAGFYKREGEQTITSKGNGKMKWRRRNQHIVETTKGQWSKDTNVV